jgi:hypothetical protein
MHADIPSWTPLQETRTYWFNPSSLEDEDEFMLVGLVLGLAIYNAVLLDFPLPLALYRKLIGQSCTLRDLQDMEPTLGKSLTALLQFEGQFSEHDNENHDELGMCRTSPVSPEQPVLCIPKRSAETDRTSACLK